MIFINNLLSKVILYMCFLTVFTGILYSENVISNTVFTLRTYSLLVGIDEINLTNFNGGAFSGKVMLSSNVSLRLGLDVYYQYIDFLRFKNGRGFFTINSSVQYYLNPLDPIKTYLGFGLVGGFSNDDGGGKIPIEVNGIFGAEWLFTKQFGLFVEYGLGGQATILLGYTNSNEFRLRPLKALLGLSVYY